MKKILLLILIITLPVLILTSNSNDPSLNDHPLPQETPKETTIIEKLDTVTYNKNSYPFIFYKIENLEKLTLSLNLPEMDSSKDIIKDEACSFLVNGGFYDQNYNPLGWFIVNGQEISKEIDSRLFNGFIQIKNDQVFITQSPLLSVKFGLQSGPLLISNNLPLPLKIKNDEPRRRVIAAINDQNQLIFITIISPESEFNGPLLAEAPQVLEKISQKINEEFISAINLDGGSASVFFIKDIYIEEFSPIGSYFCL